MIQDIDNVFDNRYKKKNPDSNSRIICISDEGIFIKTENNSICFPQANEAESVYQYLFTIGKTDYFSGALPKNNKYTPSSIRSLRSLGASDEVFAGICGFHICSWYNNNRFCGKCGSPMRHSKTERAMECSCGNIEYPKICPAVIVAVINKDKILLTRYNSGYSHWALVAGYNEFGETIEDTVHREVFEETGLKVKNLRYYKSQPWGLSSSLLFGFICDVDGDDTVKVDNIELKEGRWFTRDDINFDNDNFSLTREMISAFKKNIL